jgi:hypothetical protein
MSNNTIFTQTRIRGGEMENIFYTDKKNIRLFFLHTISVSLILILYKLEKQYLFEILNNFSSIIKYLLYFGIFLVNANVYWNNHNLGYITTLISIIGGILTNFLIKNLFPIL